MSTKADMKPQQRSYRQVTRRELLKLSPLAALGAFAIPAWQPALFNWGLDRSDRAAARIYSRAHLAPVFAPADVVPPDRFPLNSYDTDDPGVNFDTWRL